MLQVSVRGTYVVPLMMKYIHCSGSVLIERGENGGKKEEIHENSIDDRVPARDTFCLWSQYHTKEMGCICVENKSICLMCVLLVCVWE